MPVDPPVTPLRHPAVEITGLRKAYGEVAALDGLDLVVPAGTVHGLLGPNGAGTSTLMRILLGLVRPDAGTVTVTGTVGGFVEAPGAYPYLTGMAAVSARMPLAQEDQADPTRLTRAIWKSVKGAGAEPPASRGRSDD